MLIFLNILKIYQVVSDCWTLVIFLNLGQLGRAVEVCCDKL